MANRLSQRHVRRPIAAMSIPPRTQAYLGTIEAHAKQTPLRHESASHSQRVLSAAVPVESLLSGEIPDSIDPPIYALTSLSPSPRATAVQRDCIRSWLLAGMRVVAFNHPSEIDRLQPLYDGVEFVSVEQTATKTFGKHYVHISTMLRWATERDASVLLINADIVLHISPEKLDQIRNTASDGLAYIIRHNHGGDINRAALEKCGIDGFLFHGKNAAGIHSELFAMGQPAWDWWLPYMFMVATRPLYSVCGRVAYHREHPVNWSIQHHRICATELARVARTSAGEVRNAIGCAAKEIWA